MKAIEFKKKGLLYYLHKFLYVKNPEDTCSYKGQLILSFIVCLVTIHATILRVPLFLSKYIRKNTGHYAYGVRIQIIFYLLSIMSLIVGYTIIEDAPFINDFIYWSELSLMQLFLNSFIALLIGAGFIISVFSVLGILVYILNTIYILFGKFFNIIREKLPKRNTAKIKPYTQIGVLYLSAKEKWCKRITWK
jgi:hypothetical protein